MATLRIQSGDAIQMDSTTVTENKCYVGSSKDVNLAWVVNQFSHSQDKVINNYVLFILLLL